MDSVLTNVGQQIPGSTAQQQVPVSEMSRDILHSIKVHNCIHIFILCAQDLWSVASAAVTNSASLTCGLTARLHGSVQECIQVII